MAQRSKREGLILDSELMNLPDLRAYVKGSNSPFIIVSRFTRQNYPVKTESFTTREESYALHNHQSPAHTR